MRADGSRDYVVVGYPLEQLEGADHMVILETMHLQQLLSLREGQGGATGHSLHPRSAVVGVVLPREMWCSCCRSSAAQEREAPAPRESHGSRQQPPIPGKSGGNRGALALLWRVAFNSERY